MQEIWKTVITPEGIWEDYQISNLGRIKSLERKVWNGKTWCIKKERILKPGKSGNGYLVICLCKNNVQKMYHIHKLLAYVFIPNVMGYNCIDHKDTNTQNNNLSNLVWVTHKQNMNNELSKKKISKSCKGKHFSEETKKKISEANKGEKHPMYGKHHTEEARKKLSEANKGKHLSSETRNKISKNNAKSKKIICLETLEIFASTLEAERQLGICYNGISQVCRRKLKQTGKLTFRFLDQVLFYN